MASVKLDLNNKSVAEKITDGETILTATTGRTDLDPERASYATAQAALDDAEKKLAEARQKVKEAKTKRDDQEIAHDQARSLLGKKVETVTKGDEALIIATGFKVRADSTPAGEVGLIEGLTATTGDDEGEVDLAWDKEKESDSYEAQLSEASDSGPWTHLDVVRSTKLTAKSLKSGTRYWFRLRGRGKADDNRGPWSPAIAKRAS